MEKFTFALENRINELVSQPLHPEWRKQMADFLLQWEREGYRLTPRSLMILEWWIAATSKKRGFWPPRLASSPVADGRVAGSTLLVREKTGKGAFSVASSQGPALGKPPALALFPGTCQPI